MTNYRVAGLQVLDESHETKWKEGRLSQQSQVDPGFSAKVILNTVNLVYHTYEVWGPKC